MLNREHKRERFADADSPWVRSFELSAIKCLIVCRGPVRKEAMDVFDEIGIAEYGILISEKDSIVYPKCLAPELRGFRFPENIHRVPDYMGSGQAEKQARIGEIIQIATGHGYTHIFAGYGFMAEDAEFIEAIEDASIRFMGPSSRTARAVGAKDQAKTRARKLGISVTPGVDDVSACALLRRCRGLGALQELVAEHGLDCKFDSEATLEENAELVLQAGYALNLELVTIAELQVEAQRHCEEIWNKHPDDRIRLKYIGGGGGKGQRVIAGPEEVESAAMAVFAESKVVAPGSNRNFLIELNIENTRHNEIQIIGNGDWCVSLGGRDCSVQMHEQKLLEVSLTLELLAEEIKEARSRGQHTKLAVLEADYRALEEMEREAEQLGESVGLDSVSTFETIVDRDHHYFMEVNTRIQVEHRVTEQAYTLRFCNPDDSEDCFSVDSLVEAMALLSQHGPRLPRPERVERHASGAEVRINATNAALQPHAGGMITSWSPPVPGEIRDDQGIGIHNPDTGSFVYYCVAGAYDSNIALVVAHGSSRKENLERVAEILRCTELRGIDVQTNLDVHYGLLAWMLGHDAMVKPSTQFMDSYLAVVGRIAEVAGEVDLKVAWSKTLSGVEGDSGRQVLALKKTLITRPLARILARPHALAGFLGLHSGRYFLQEGGRVELVVNPIDVLRDLYHFLNLDARAGQPASEMIWDHDQRILDDAHSFYHELQQRLGTATYPQLVKQLAHAQAPEAFAADPALWEAVRASHAGFQLGMELLLLLPRVGEAADFFSVKVNDDLSVSFPEYCRDSESRSEHQRRLAPPPLASSDEIVTPMGGHYFSREAPHLQPLIEEGGRFKAGQPLFVIEVMKMFNQIAAPFSGRVTQVLLRDADGEIVKKGQLIMKVEPDERLIEESPESIAARRRSATERLLE
jgi:acetyl/propionyl-CoA carboxylase alpha subunit